MQNVRLEKYDVLLKHNNHDFGVDPKSFNKLLTDVYVSARQKAKEIKESENRRMMIDMLMNDTKPIHKFNLGMLTSKKYLNDMTNDEYFKILLCLDYPQ